MGCAPPTRAPMGCTQLPTWGRSFYSSFGGLTKKFRTNLAQKRCIWSFYSSSNTPMKKFRTIAGQRLHTTYPLILNNYLGRYGMSAERPEICSKQQHLQGTHTTPQDMGPNKNADGEAFPRESSRA